MMRTVLRVARVAAVAVGVYMGAALMVLLGGMALAEDEFLEDAGD